MGQGLEIMLMGIGTVFAVLLVLWGAIALLRWVVPVKGEAAAVPAPASREAAYPPEPVSGIPTRTVAAIMAALTASGQVTGEIRISNIRTALPARVPQVGAWVVAGREQLMQSRVRYILREGSHETR